MAQVSFELRQDEEELASEETILERGLSRMVEELTFKLADGGPIMTY